MNADDHLRRLRNDDRWNDDAPPREPNGGSRITLRSRRSLTPLLATAVTAVLVVVVGGAVLFNSRSELRAGVTATATPSNGSTVIPWMAAAPPPAPTGGVSLGVAVGEVPLCALAQLKVTSRQGGSAMGTWRQGVTLTNRGNGACRLSASDLALQALSDGRYLTFGKTLMEDGSATFRLEPGTTAHFWASLSQRHRARDFDTAVPVPTYLSVGGERIRLAGTVPSDFRPLCAHPDAVGGPSTFGQEGDVPEAVSPYADLRATITVPDTVHAGETLEYTVSLSNPTSKPISIAPCPTFDQTYAGSGGGKQELLVVMHHVLNCASVPVLQPRRSASFAMRTVIPAGARGPAKISWSIGGNASATALRTISSR